MSEVATTKPKPMGLREMLDAPNIKAGISAALGGFMDEDNFLSQMLIAFQAPGSGGNPGVIDCTLDSKFKAAHVCATLGLLPTLGQVALIPRNMKDQGLCVTVMPQWQGFQALMLRNPEVKSVKATLVHASDSYVYDPDTESLTQHTFDPFDPTRMFRNFDDLRGGYLTVTWTDGRPKTFHFVKRDTFEKARKCAQGDGIWTKWFEEQCLKTVYRNAYARRVIPIDPFASKRIQALVESEDLALGNDPARIIDVPAVAAITYTPEAAKTSRTEAAATKMKKADTKTSKKVDDPPEEKQTDTQSETTSGPIPFDHQIEQAKTLRELGVIERAVIAANLSIDETDFLKSMIAEGMKRIG